MQTRTGRAYSPFAVQVGAWPSLLRLHGRPPCRCRRRWLNGHCSQEIGGKPVIGVSPRLSVFRKEAGQWLMVSHANFARLG